MPAGFEELVTVAVSINDQRLFSFVYGALQALLLLLCYEQSCTTQNVARLRNY